MVQLPRAVPARKIAPFSRKGSIMGPYPKAEWSWRSGVSFLFILAAVIFIGLIGKPAPAHGQEAMSTEDALKQALGPQADTGSPLYRFYAARDFRPAWTGSQRAEHDASVAMSVLAHAGSQGLDDADYAMAASRWNAPPAPGDEAAAYDIFLSADVLHYAADVRLGRTDPHLVYKDVALPAQSFDAAASLNQALRVHRLEEFLVDLPPVHPEYRALAAALARYRLVAANGGWPMVGRAGPIGQPNALALRLSLDDPYLTGVPAPAGDEIAQALTRFQIRNGLPADGKLGPATIAALNVPIATRIQQIIANMERWRWMPRTFEMRSIRVNVPDQTLQYVEYNQILLSSRVGVGRIGSRSPITRMVAEDLVVNPPWHVPDDIAASQILPKLRKQPNYLATHNMVLENGPPGDPHGRNIDWNKMTSFPYLVDQAPGPDSAMGVFMLDAPNEFGVYLHDTPGRGIFNADMRQVSNGCIRVQQMLPLVSLVLTGDSNAAQESLKPVIATKQTTRIDLDAPIPIYLMYWTAVADEDGLVGFRSDFYGRDRPLLAALGAPRSAVTAGLDQSPIARVPS
jgi:murein L,D-transpeptidase YcbB/YkuD